MKLYYTTVILAACEALFAFAGGTGSELDPYLVQTPSDLMSINNELDAHYLMAADIDMSAHPHSSAVVAPDTGSSSDSTFTGTVFTGSFSGGGFKISNLIFNNSPADYVGLFGKVVGAHISDLTLENCDVAGNYYSSLLLGYGDNITVEAITIENCSLTLAPDSSYAGLLSGYCKYSTFSDCSINGEIDCGDSDYISLASGYILSCDYTNCFVTGTATLDDDVDNFGSLTGRSLASCLFTNCHSKTIVTTGERCWQIGGFAGRSDYLNAIDCSASGWIDVDGRCVYIAGFAAYMRHCSFNRCYSNVNIGTYSEAQYVGGFGAHFSATEVSNSYYLGVMDVDSLSDDIAGFIASSDVCDYTDCFTSAQIILGYYCEDTGGFCATDSGSDFYDCFWNTETTGLDNSIGGSGATTAQLQSESFYLAAGWDFIGESNNGTNDYWLIQAGTYPRLVWQGYAGDCDEDGDIDNDDICPFAANWLSEVVDFAGSAADCNLDGFIDLNDLSILAANQAAF